MWSFPKSVIILATVFVIVQGTRFEFVFDNDEVFDNCPEIPGSNGAHDMFDYSEFKFVFNDGSVQCSGKLTCQWEGVQPTDRIQIRSEIYKYRRGAWQPTPFTTALNDFCKQQFDKNSVWYQLWTRYIPEEERICITNYGHVYHTEEFDVDTVFDFVINMEGRHKIVVYMEAFDEQNIKRSKIICYQIFGEFVKVK